MLKRVVVALAVLAGPAATSAQNTQDADHTDLYFTPQQETPTDYTNGSVRLGNIPGQDLVRPLGGSGTPLGLFKPSRPANATTNAADAPITHLRQSRQTVALDRDPDTGLPLDVYSRKARGLAEDLETSSARSANAATALSDSDPH